MHRNLLHTKKLFHVRLFGMENFTLLLLLFTTLLIHTTVGLDCYVGCAGSACAASSTQAPIQPTLIKNVDANAPTYQLPMLCYSVCDPLGATIFGAGGAETIASLTALSSGAAAAGFSVTTCPTSGCNNPATTNCPTPTGGGSLLPMSRLSGISACTSSNGNDLSEYMCQYTPLGVNCPPNYYCPKYSLLDIFVYHTVLDESGCSYGPIVAALTGNSSYAVMCPCTPGFLCPANTEVPTHCPPGNYCPPNPMVKTTPLGNPIPVTGLGTFGSLAYECPAGTWCSPGLVVPFECDNRLMVCTAGTTHPQTWKIVVLILVGAALLYVPLHIRFLAAKMRRARRKIAWEKEKNALKTRIRENLREAARVSRDSIPFSELKNEMYQSNPSISSVWMIRQSMEGNTQDMDRKFSTSEAVPILNNLKTVRELRESLGVRPGDGEDSQRTRLHSPTLRVLPLACLIMSLILTAALQVMQSKRISILTIAPMMPVSIVIIITYLSLQSRHYRYLVLAITL